MEIEQTIQQVERFIRKVAQKFPAQLSEEDNTVLTDIHVRVSQDSGELLAFDDEDNEITRCVVEQWIDNKDENFYDEVAKTLRDIMRKNSETIDNLGILKPYSFVLEDDDKENLGELYLADKDTIRGMFGNKKVACKNAAHGSGNPKEADEEIQRFFKDDMVEIIKSVDSEKKKEYEQSMLGKKLSTNKCVYTDSYFEREKIDEIEKEYKSFTYKKEI